MVTNSETSSTPSSGTCVSGGSQSSRRPMVMPESFAVDENKEWDSWVGHFEDCAAVKVWSDEHKMCIDGSLKIMVKNC